ncbi:MAG: hypothetical protein IPK83_14400 [Planctomycetes bacterium]|nr:hypothetical protein [Planctomycetota bacterium]
MNSKLDVAIAFCGLFEAEVLTSLMLSHWGHPRATEKDLVIDLVETASEVLARARLGEKFVEGVQPTDMSFIAAIWYAEANQVHDSNDEDVSLRREWLRKVQRSLPSCFCDPDDLVNPEMH